MTGLKQIVRRAKKLPFMALVRESGLSKSTLSAMLSDTAKNRVTNPRVDTFDRLQCAVIKLEREREARFAEARGAIDAARRRNGAVIRAGKGA